jgi:sugar phosphate isomerase/epimerase
MLTRRQFNQMALASLSAPLTSARVDSTIGGVRIGVQSYSFRDRPLDAMIKDMVALGLGTCELWQGHVEPRLPDDYGKPSDDARKRGELRKWRETVSMKEFADIGRKFRNAGIELHAYDYSFRDDFSESEIARGFEMARTLGVKFMVASSTLSMARRLDPLAGKAGIRIGMHGHSNTSDPNEFSSPESFERVLAQCSPNIGVALDIGHFLAAGGDPVAFLNKHHDRIYMVHLKDRKKNQGLNRPWGRGDTPIREVLQMLKTRKYPLPAEIEYAYQGADTVAEMRTCFDYCKRILAGS